MGQLNLTPTTELEAVNLMLVSIGEQPVNTLEQPGVSEVSIARDILHQVSRQVQAIGLRCNSESNYRLPVDVDGYIILPSNTLSVDASDPTMDVVQRGNKLYDRKNHTYKFAQGVEVDIVFFLPFEELPQVVRDYIAIRAARVFQAKTVGSEALHAFTAEDEQKAYLALVAAEIDSGDYNIFNNSDIQRMLQRS